MVIAVVLGELAEANMRRGLSMSSGDVSIFFTRPVSLFFIAIAVCSLLFPTIRKLMDYSRAKRKANVTETSDDKN